MALYRFALHNEAGPHEHLGFMTMPRDDAAVAFGREVAADITQQSDPAHDGATMLITEGERQVGSVPLAVAQRRKKTR